MALPQDKQKIKMLKSKKHVFWEALVITIVIFLIGLFLGMLIETTNSSKIANLYLQSEISLTDAMAASRLTEEFDFDCNAIKESNINFADRVYIEAKLLEEYEDSGKLTENMISLHKKYDLLRTLLWTSNQNSLERCNNYNLIVYLYKYESENITKKATQNVWSKIIMDVKNQNKDILLLPIATDQNLTSLDLLINEQGITQFPALIINNNQILYDLQNTASIEQFLN
ncbi:hypothetical protein KAI32_00800 [Candidatus Pacearchaeota archaeon]|nr:hypothetical protein [Candidatus Pacearchaeota archaeon]